MIQPLLPRELFLWYGFKEDITELTDTQMSIFLFASAIHIGIL